MQTNKVVYSASIGMPVCHEPTFKNPGWDHLFFTDSDKPCEGWEARRVDPPNKSYQAPRRLARFLKIKCHVTLPDHSISLWIDSKWQLAVDPDDLVAKYMPEGVDLVVMRHGWISNIYDEAKLVLKLKMDDPGIIAAQLARYRKEGLPEQPGDHAATGLLLRRHTPVMKSLMNEWWDEVEAGSCRDQISFDYVMRKHSVKIGYMPYYAMQKLCRR